MIDEKLQSIFDSIIQTTFETHYDGTVVDDEDPDKLGRLRVRIPELYGNIPVEHIPWANPAQMFGGGEDYGSFWIPPKKSKVHIRLRRGHPWFPEWYGVHWFKGEPPIETHDGELLSPKNYLFKTPEKHIIDLHDSQDGKQYIRIKDSEENFIFIDTTDNSIHIKAKGDINIEAGGDFSVKAGGVVHIRAGSAINEDAGRIDLNSGKARPKPAEDRGN